METNQILVDIHSSTRPIQSGQNLYNLHKFIMYFIHRKISSILLNPTDLYDLGLETLSFLDPYTHKKRNLEYKIEYGRSNVNDSFKFNIKTKLGQQIRDVDIDDYETLKYFINGFKLLTGLTIVRYRQYDTKVFLDILDESESVHLDQINDTHIHREDYFKKDNLVDEGHQSYLDKRWGNGEKYPHISCSFRTKERRKEMITRDAIDNCIKELTER